MPTVHSVEVHQEELDSSDEVVGLSYDVFLLIGVISTMVGFVKDLLLVKRYVINLCRRNVWDDLNLSSMEGRQRLRARKSHRRHFCYSATSYCPSDLILDGALDLGEYESEQT